MMGRDSRMIGVVSFHGPEVFDGCCRGSLEGSMLIIGCRACTNFLRRLHLVGAIREERLLQWSQVRIFLRLHGMQRLRIG